jgi:toxin ParE1/3/4
MAQIKWTEPALDDLNEIAEYIALDNPSDAKKFVQETFKAVKRLKDFPNSGKIPTELKNSRCREIIVAPCRVLYRVDVDLVFILYVMRSERALRNFILEDRSANTV